MAWLIKHCQVCKNNIYKPRYCKNYKNYPIKNYYYCSTCVKMYEIKDVFVKKADLIL